MPAQTFSDLYPKLADWLGQEGWIELGFEPETNTCARALDEGGTVWQGGRVKETVDEWLAAMEPAVGAYMDEIGL